MEVLFVSSQDRHEDDSVRTILSTRHRSLRKTIETSAFGATWIIARTFCYVSQFTHRTIHRLLC